jgi:cyanophycin synthetase
VTKAAAVPLTYGGKAVFMIQNVLPAVLAAYTQGISIEDIKVALETFIPSPGQTPGRLNMFEFKNFHVLLDYAHNAAGLRALQQMVVRLDGAPKVGIIAGIGDRRIEDNQEIGKVAAEMFDEIIIRQDKHLRGKSEKELIDMLLVGIKSVDANKKITVIPSEKEAINHAITNAAVGSLIVICSDVVPDALAQVTQFKEEEMNRLYEFDKSQIPNR